MKGIIILNPYKVPKNSVHQAKRLKEEFKKKKVEIEIVYDAFVKTRIENNCIKTTLKNVDFIVYLDKDKYLSEQLKKLNVKLFNSHEAIRLCDDKGETYIALSNKNISVPDTYFAGVCYSKDLMIKGDYLKDVYKKLGFPLIVKESYGSMGKGVYLIKNKKKLYEIDKKLKLVPHLYQKYIDAVIGVDIRVIVIGGKVVASMERKNEKDFRSNIAQGGKGYRIQLEKSFVDMAEKTAKALKLDYCGVDLLIDRENEPIVCEVNSNAFFDEIEKISKVNVAEAYCEYIIKSIGKDIGEKNEKNS